MDEQAREATGALLRAEVEGAGRGELGRWWRCPADVKAKVVRYAAECRATGDTLADIAIRVGLVESMLARWLRREVASRRPAFRQVAIVPSPESERGEQRPSGGLCLVSPRGYRVEGLDAATAAALLRVLG